MHHIQNRPAGEKQLTLTVITWPWEAFTAQSQIIKTLQAENYSRRESSQCLETPPWQQRLPSNIFFMLHGKKYPLTSLTWITKNAVLTPQTQWGNTNEPVEINQQRMQLDFVSILSWRKRKELNWILEVLLAKLKMQHLKPGMFIQLHHRLADGDRGFYLKLDSLFIQWNFSSYGWNHQSRFNAMI